MAWILDDGPLDILAAEVDAGDLTTWPSDRLFVAEATAEAAEVPGLDGRRAKILSVASRSDGGPVIRRFDIPVKSAAGKILYGHLRKDAGSISANLAEHQSIVWALMEHQTAVFVVKDKYAAYLALSELGKGRVCHPFDFWRWLREENLISSKQMGGLDSRTLRADQSLPGIPWRLQKKF